MTDADAVRRYHDGTKHDFNRFARALGYLDWAAQPDPFRAYAGAPAFPLRDSTSPVAHLLRYSLGLSAWKSFGASRWALRVNPSSGNLHPTEGYVVAGAGTDLPGGPGVYHFAPDRHALEQRCTFTDAPAGLLVALTSIHWREAWKYGERAFRYCQHDLGHAIAAIAYAAAHHGWSAALVPSASDDDLAVLTGTGRDADFVDAERETPGCAIAIDCDVDLDAFLAAARAGRWRGHANQLSEDHVQWTFIDDVAAATRGPGFPIANPRSRVNDQVGPDRSLLLRRRSAVAFDGRTTTDAAAFARILASTMPPGVPFDTLWWSPRIHLLLFVHRVSGVAPGLYLVARSDSAVDRLRAACGREFAWARVAGELPLFELARGDCRTIAQRLSCDQAIAADGFFSLGMLAEFDASLAEFGPSFYRQLFWESGVVGQALYLAAEREGARGTGIGCFYDDRVHELLGIADHSFQSLYHFTVGMPIEDTRLTTEPGYPWESAPR